MRDDVGMVLNGVYGVAAVLLVIPLLFRNKWWLLAYVVVVGGAVTKHWLTPLSSRDALGDAVFAIWTLGFLSGLALRMVEVLFRWASNPNASVPKSMIAILALVGIWLVYLSY